MTSAPLFTIEPILRIANLVEEQQVQHNGKTHLQPRP